MRITMSALVVLAAAAAGASCSKVPTSAGATLVGVWGSDTAGLAVTDSGGTLRILSSGTCYGQYADVARPLSAPRFDLPAVFTQLEGAYPGKLEYAAEVTGSVSGDGLAAITHRGRSRHRSSSMRSNRPLIGSVQTPRRNRCWI